MLRTLSLAAAAAITLCALPAQASTVTYRIDITAGPSVAASYTLTFDPTVLSNNVSTGITVNSYSGFDGSIPVGYYYTPASYPDPSVADSIEIGGLAGGVDYVNPGDYRFDIANLTTAPTFTGFQARSSSTNGVDITSSTGTVRLTLIPSATAATPEPSSLALLGTGVLGLLGAARRRFV